MADLRLCGWRREMNASALSLIEGLGSIIENKDMVKKHHNEHVRRYTELMLEKVMRFYPD